MEENDAKKLGQYFSEIFTTIEEKSSSNQDSVLDTMSGSILK